KASLHNRKFTNEVRLAVQNESSSRKKKPVRNQGPELERIEDELMWLQLIGKFLIVHTKDVEETAEMIGILSSDIARIPYKNRNGNLDFWVENRIRTGADCSDTWLRMLQEIQLVTHPVAKGVVKSYPTVKLLYDGYKKCDTREEAENLLADVEISNTGLGQRNRHLNKALSKKIYEIFMGNDPNAIVS
ncbi:36_t:CDS:2, partial [Acaulospora morrowiae]